MSGNNGNAPPESDPIPYSKEAEEALLGSAIIDPAILLTTKVSPADFYVHKHRWIWEEMITLSRAGMTPDLVMLAEALQRRGRLVEIGGPAYLTGLANKTPSSLSSDNYAKIIKSDAVRRAVLGKARALTMAAFDQTVNIQSAVSSTLRDLAVDASPDNSAVHFSELLGGLYDEVEERYKNPVDFWGIKTGFSEIDKLTGGLQLAEVFYLAGEPGIGKSKLAIQIAVQIALAGTPVAIFSLEMKNRAIARRIVSFHSKVFTRKLKSGRMEADDWNDFTKSVDELSQIPLYISDNPRLTTLQFRAELARLKMDKGVKVGMLDYLLLMGDTALSREVKTVAGELDLALVAVNSVTKEHMGVGSSPTNRGVRGSGQLAHDADVIAFLTAHKPDMGDPSPNIATLTFTKGREFESGNLQIDLYAHPNFPSFGDLADRRVETEKAIKTLEGMPEVRQDWLR